MNLMKQSKTKFLIIVLAALFGFSQMNAQLEPNLVYPEANDTCVTHEVVFLWDSVAGSNQYRIQVSSSATWTNPDLANVVLSHPTTSYTMAFEEGNTDFYWRVSSSITEVETYSDIQKFTTLLDPPNLIGPDDNETCVGIKPVFEWSEVEGATAYSLQIAYSTTFSGEEIVYTNHTVPTSSYSSKTYSVQLPNHFMNYYWRVAVTHGDCRSDWSEPFLFSTKQDSPNATFPSDDSVGLPLDITLSWTEPLSGSTYDVEFASDANFSNMINSYYGISERSATVSPLDYNMDYFWRLKAHKFGCESEWSDTYRFKTQFTAPILDLPQDGRICLEMTYQFRWLQIANAQSYHMQISTDMAFDSLVYDEEDIFDLIHEVNLPDGLTQYYWRVRAKDQNNFGAWSEVWNFTTTVEAVTPVYPQPNAQGVASNIILKWSDVTMSNGTYNMQLASDPEFETLIYDEEDLTSTSFTVDLPSYNADYYWRVSATYDQCEAPFDDVWRFRTIIPSPTLLTPTDSSTGLDFTVFFEWNPIADADSYEFHLALSHNFAPIDFGYNNITNNHYYMSGLDPDTRYFWRVRAVNEDGMSDFSQVYTFTTNSLGASIPTLVYPLVDADQVELTPLLRWTAADRAEYYHLQVAEDSEFSSFLVDVDTLTVTSYQMDTLENDMTYYWHVSAINDSGETQFSKLGYFTTEILPPTDAPMLDTPVNGADSLDPKRVPLKWAAVERAEAYELVVATDDAFTNIVFEDEDVYSTSILLQMLEYETTYYWKVMAKNKSGDGPWSETYNFTTKIFVSVKDEMQKKYNIGTYPNPFSESNALTFSLNVSESVTVKVHDITGKVVAELLSEVLPAGDHQVKWQPSGMESSTYFYSIEIGNKKTYQEVTFAK